MKNLILLSVLLLLSLCGICQKGNGTYDLGVGVKYYPAAVSIKKYTKKGDALEMLLIKYDEGVRATILAELSPNITMKKNLRLVLGPGLHVAVREKKHLVRTETNPVVGMDGVFGMEWKIPKIPFSIQVDYQPSIDIIGNSDTYNNWGGATIRYTW